MPPGTLTITLNVATLMVWLVLGAFFGILIGLALRERVGPGLALVAGAVGAFVAGTLFGLLRLETPPSLAGEIVIRVLDIVLALVGAVVAVIIVGLYRRFNRR